MSKIIYHGKPTNPPTPSTLSHPTSPHRPLFPPLLPVIIIINIFIITTPKSTDTIEPSIFPSKTTTTTTTMMMMMMASPNHGPLNVYESKSGDDDGISWKWLFVLRWFKHQHDRLFWYVTDMLEISSNVSNFRAKIHTSEYAFITFVHAICSFCHGEFKNPIDGKKI